MKSQLSNKNKLLINEIENICCVLINYCQNTEKTDDNNNILTMLNCMYEKIEKLYININNS